MDALKSVPKGNIAVLLSKCALVGLTAHLKYIKICQDQ